MSRYELTKVWILLVLLPFSSSLEPTVITSCETAIDRGLPSGIYRLDEPYLTKLNWIWDTLEVYCEKAAGVGWIVIQRRGEFGDHRENFTRSWDDYARGFGDLNGEFWFGNEWIHRLTSDVGAHDLRIELEDWEGQKLWGQYSDFKIASERYLYKLLSTLELTGNAWDSLPNLLYEEPFKTHDRLSYDWKYAPLYFGGWWGGRGDRRPSPNSPYDGQYEAEEMRPMEGHSFKSAKVMLRSRHYRSLYKIKTTNRL